MTEEERTAIMNLRRRLHSAERALVAIVGDRIMGNRVDLRAALFHLMEHCPERLPKIVDWNKVVDAIKTAGNLQPEDLI